MLPPLLASVEAAVASQVWSCVSPATAASDA
jgi:hypothetical protein